MRTLVWLLCIAMLLAACSGPAPQKPSSPSPTPPPPPTQNDSPVDGDQPRPVAADQAIPANQCDSFCNICKRFEECKLETYAECRRGCMDACTKTRLSKVFEACTQGAADCAALQKCLETEKER